MFSNRIIFIGSALLLFLFMQCHWPVPSPVPTNILFMVLGTMLVFMNMQGGVKTDGLIIWLIAGIVLSIVSNTIPPFFKPWQRLVQFLLLAIAVSPLITGENIDRIRRQMTMGVIWASGAIGALSFLGYILGFGTYMSGIIQGYMGITPHPNFLGMYCIIAMVWFASLFFRSTNVRERTIFASLWVGCMVVLLLSASRSSTACGLLGTVIVAYLRFQENAGRLMTAGLIMAALAVLALPYLAPYTDTMMQKGVSVSGEESDELVAATRGGVWTMRYLEIAKSPLVGVGAYACDITLPHANVYYVEKTGTVEQGSSYLGLLAQIGWIGFLPFALLLYMAFRKSYRYATKEKTPYAQLILAMLVPIMVHMIVEGYAITAGAIQCVILWAIIGAAYQCDKVADYPVFWEEEDPITPEEYVEWKEQQEE